MKIQKVTARMVLDSRGNPTIESEIHTKSFVATACVPSGASTGKHEARELRDKAKAFSGKGVNKAIKNTSKISSKLKSINVNEQRKIDDFMIKLDKTKNKRNLGANTILGVSMAATRAAAAAHRYSLYHYLADLYGNKKNILPMPFANVINGGVHAGNELMFQEFMIVPVGAKTFSEATRMISEVYHELKGILAESFGKEATAVGDEGGFAPPISLPDEALELLSVAVEHAGYKGKIKFAIDAAASEFYDKKKKMYEATQGRFLDSNELTEYYVKLIKKYPIIRLEDPFDEDDFDAFSKLMKKTDIQIVGDDLTVTNPKRIETAIKKKACNALLLKINQIGTITEAMQAAHMAQKAGWKIMVSHRSGETEDPYIADLAVGIASGQIKLGAPCRGERTAKYNQLLRIEEELGKAGKFAKF